MQAVRGKANGGFCAGAGGGGSGQASRNSVLYGRSHESPGPHPGAGCVSSAERNAATTTQICRSPRNWPNAPGLALDNSRLYAESRQAREAAEAANAAKDRFLAMLSHELRTPLSPVLHATTLLEEQDCPEPMRATLETIRRNVQLEARLIDDLLDLARIRNGKLQLQSEPVEAHDLLRRAVDICQADITTRHLQLTLDLRATHTTLEADPARIQQIFWNLISNAVKYTPAGGTIALRTEDDESAGALRVEVADSGVGIESVRLESIFDAFEQANSGRSGGLGLGLAICRALAALHGGRIEARSGGAGPRRH
ncbi:MAG: HAMP domain-containing sensor histidine kinase, partial [Chthoniobacter sp.]